MTANQLPMAKRETRTLLYIFFIAKYYCAYIP